MGNRQGKGATYLEQLTNLQEQDPSALKGLLEGAREELKQTENVKLMLERYPQALKMVVEVVRGGRQESDEGMTEVGLEIIYSVVKVAEGAQLFLEKYRGVEMLMQIALQYQRALNSRLLALVLKIMQMIIIHDFAQGNILIERGLLTILSPILFSNNNTSLISAALELVNEITEGLDFEILTVLATDTSFIPNLVMLLTSSGQKDNIQSFILSILANLGYLKEVQNNSYVIKSALPLILKIYQDKRAISKTRIQASRCLRQFTQSSSFELQKQLKTLNAINIMLGVLSLEQVDDSHLTFFSLLTLLQLSSQLDPTQPMHHLSRLTHQTWTTHLNLADQLLFSSTLAHFSRQATSSHLTELIPGFVTLCFSFLKRTGLKGSTAQSPEDKVKSRIQNSCLEALKWFSLLQVAHPLIFSEASAVIDLIEQINFDSQVKELDPLIALNNCLMSQDARSEIEGEVVDGTLERYHEFLLRWHSIDEVQMQTSNNKEVLRSLEIECTLALTLLEGTMSELTTSGKDQSKANYLIHIIRTQSDPHFLCKALVSLLLLTDQPETCDYLMTSNIISLSSHLLSITSDPLVHSTTCTLLGRFLTHPSGLLLSLPLTTSTNPTLNLACPSSYLLSHQGEPTPSPGGGVLFDDSDALSIMGQPLRPKHHWTITAMVQVPNQPGVHSLVAGKGECVHLMLLVKREGQVLIGQRCAEGEVMCAEGEVGRYGNGWHQVVAVAEEGRVGYWWDGKRMGQTERAIGMSSMRYIGNSSKGKEPFGMVRDLRIYNKALELRDIQTIDTQLKLLISKYLPILDNLLGLFTSACPPLLLPPLAMLLSKLAAQPDLRPRLLQAGLLHRVLELLSLPNLSHQAQTELQKILISLQ